MSDIHATVTSAVELMELTVEIVSAYVAKNNLPMSELPALSNGSGAILVQVSGRLSRRDEPGSQ